jgi:hypothetical protein
MFTNLEKKIKALKKLTTMSLLSRTAQKLL